MLWEILEELLLWGIVVALVWVVVFVAPVHAETWSTPTFAPWQKITVEEIKKDIPFSLDDSLPGSVQPKKMEVAKVRYCMLKTLQGYYRQVLCDD